MKYDLDWVIEQYNKDSCPDFLFFWGHRRAKDGSISSGCLSQWWIDDFHETGITYQSAEHWMMAEKARLFQDEITLQEILAADSPDKAKKLGRKVASFDEDVWTEHRYAVVVRGNELKFSQNVHLKSYLVNTGNRILVEASPYDRIWGIGMTEAQAWQESPRNWQGLNLLGFALMEVRDKLQNKNS